MQRRLGLSCEPRDGCDGGVIPSTNRSLRPQGNTLPVVTFVGQYEDQLYCRSLLWDLERELWGGRQRGAMCCQVARA